MLRFVFVGVVAGVVVVTVLDEHGSILMREIVDVA